MSGEHFEQADRDTDDGLQSPDLGPLRAAAEREEVAEAQDRLANSFGGPLRPGDPYAPLARDVACALTEAGFTLHDGLRYHQRYRLGGVCLLPVPAGHNPDGQGGIAVSWTTHDLLALDWERDGEHQGTQEAMNRALASVLTALGYQVQPFGTDGASLITGSCRSTPATTRRSRPSREQR